MFCLKEAEERAFAIREAAHEALRGGDHAEEGILLGEGSELLLPSLLQFIEEGIKILCHNEERALAKALLQDCPKTFQSEIGTEFVDRVNGFGRVALGIAFG